MDYLESNEYLKIKYPLSRFLENGDLRWPDYFDYEEAEFFVFTARFCSSLTSFQEDFYFNEKDKEGLLDHESLTLKNWTFCEILTSATVYYLESVADTKGEILSFRWSSVILLLFESRCSALLFVILKQLKYTQSSILEFIESVNDYLVSLEEELIQQEKTNKTYLESIPTKKHCVRVLSLVLVNENFAKQLVENICIIQDSKMKSTNFNSIRMYLEILLQILTKN